MRCNICNCDIIDGIGNNPYPLCGKDDNEARCCDACNDLVTMARIYGMQYEMNGKVKEGDVVAILYSKESDLPIKTFAENGKILGGEVTDDEGLPDGCFEGMWGNFLLNTNTDNYIVVPKK